MKADLHLPGKKEVHLYDLCLADYENFDECYKDILSEEEKDRCVRFISIPERARYIQVHCLLRIILASYLKCWPFQVELCRTKSGKPVLSGQRNLHFSISYRDEYLFVAVSGNQFIGCDIEKIAAVNYPEEYLKMYFSLEEIGYINSGIGETEKLTSLLRIWTMKEAFVKAKGMGIDEKMKDYNFVPFFSEEVITLPFDEGNRWMIRVRNQHVKYLAALAFRGSMPDITCFQDVPGSESFRFRLQKL